MRNNPLFKALLFVAVAMALPVAAGPVVGIIIAMLAAAATVHAATRRTYGAA